MKKLLQSAIFKKSLILLVAFIALIVLLDQVVLPWYVSSPEAVVPNVVGKTESEAFEILADSGFEPAIADTSFNEKYPSGTIILQKPKAGETVKEGRVIYLFLSGGEPIVYVPKLVGRSIRDAKFSLERLGLKLGEINQVSSNHPKDMIFDQQYAEGTPLKKGDEVGVTVSIGKGEGLIEVPDLIGKSLAEATMILKDSSLVVGKINYQQSFSLLPNTVLDQYPGKGNRLNPGDAVDLFVTKSSNN